MNVTQFCTFPFGGAGAAAIRHHTELLRFGISSRLLHRGGVEAANKEKSIEPVNFAPAPEKLGFFASLVEKSRRRRIIRQYERHLRDRPTSAELFSQSEMLDKTCLGPEFDWGDLVHLHWVAFLLDLPSFFESLPLQVPVVWTLHDMNPITGGCHYSDGCNRFLRGCGDCPQLRGSYSSDLSHDAIEIKRRVLRDRVLHVVSPSRWLNQLAQQSPVWPAGTEFHVIGYGVDTTQFRPIAKPVARHTLGLPQNVTLLAFGADDIANPRKGFHSLIQALRMLPPEKPFECIVFGRGRLPDDRDRLPIFHEMGFIDSPERRANVYAAADIYVLPSLEDNLPQTGLEALACGTAVAAYQAGGIPEIVMPGQTGFLAPVGNVAALARQITELAEHPRLRQRLAAGGRRLIEIEYELRKQTRKYVDLYQTILGQKAVTPLRQVA